MRSALLVLSAIVIVLLLPATMWAINDFRSSDHGPEPHFVTTDPLQEDADIILSQALFGNHTSNVTITSDNPLDTPRPNTYTKADRELNVIGLKDDDTRTLAVTYKIDALVDYFGAGIASRVWPVFIILGIIGLIAGAVYQATRRGE